MKLNFNRVFLTPLTGGKKCLEKPLDLYFALDFEIYAIQKCFELPDQQIDTVLKNLLIKAANNKDFQKSTNLQQNVTIHILNLNV